MILRKVDIQRVIAVTGLLILVLSVLFIGISISLASSWFTWESYALSNLGASSDSRLVFNSGLMILGVLIIIYALLLIIGSYKRDKFFSIPSIILLTSGVALFGVGYYPMDIAPRTHWNFAFAFFVLLSISMLIYGTYFSFKKNYLLGILGILGFINSLIVWYLIPWKTLGITGVAIPEALSIFPPMLWILIFSYLVFQDKISVLSS